jgi:hypothetical protein
MDSLVQPLQGNLSGSSTLVVKPDDLPGLPASGRHAPLVIAITRRNKQSGPQ